MLASYTPSGSTVTRTLKYDANGIRCEKNTRAFGQDDITIYVYDGNKLIREYRVNEPSSQKTFLYNSQGIIGFVYQGVTYTYRKNLFGDIIAIYQGATKVAEYKYDAWGNQKIMDGNSNVTNDLTHIANVNPFRYRGYYWENEIKLYYLMSRYYDPLTGRFINADTLDYLDPESINGLNLYAYCGNNPVMYADPSGHSIILFALIVGAVIGAGIGAGVGIANGKRGWDLFASIMAGASIATAIVGLGIGLLGVGATISAGATSMFLGLKAQAVAAIGLLVADAFALISNAFLGSNFQLFEWGGSYTPDTPKNNTPLPNFNK